MRIVIMAVGSYGDVAPYTGLATALTRAGHGVAIATHTPYEAAVTSIGLEFRPLPMDPRAALAEGHGRRAGGSSPLALRHSIQMIAEHQRDLGQGILEAATGADMLLLSPMAWLGWHVAQGLGIRSAGAYLQPWTPTASFPPAAMTTRSLGAWGNRHAARLLRTTGQRPARQVINDLRAGLGLAPMTPAESFAEMESAGWPIFYGFSAAVVPAPADWRRSDRVVGYWWPEVDPQWTPAADLVDFLEAGPPPVFLGFGSMHLEDPAALGRILSEAVRMSGVRAVVQSADARLRADGDVLAIDSVPHSWLFPRTAAVLHHCGAGTAAAGLRAGIPTIPVPMMLDQPFWARRLQRIGVATEPLSFNRIAAQPLADRITRAVGDDAMRARVRDLALVIGREDGYAPVVSALAEA
jgi:sterol 3beta-glucosyltransferase